MTLRLVDDEREHGLCRYCGTKVELSDAAIKRWRIYNKILKSRGERILAVDEVSVCRQHYTKWKLERDAVMNAEIRQAREAERAAREATAGVDELD